METPEYWKEQYEATSRELARALRENDVLKRIAKGVRDLDREMMEGGTIGGDTMTEYKRLETELYAALNEFEAIKD